uniref:Uncharacterized protein n=1 Tax=Chromera velia CCMP2878 TaxID=1169474 RepID=A0A0G4I137_9ALVE|eukprot:Cvel_16.t1-p1 / transcript=Cvel_16.t1 / gene=Cvel_16 / organism=Chromera_velia_CCMP2878 / gene_product=hypothetical protein / transcript_product=hypothetical protein / location=Cvel_scaffold5:102969-105066(-) / protein_length=576 / sequence_SO=supercontig / SO=protein_coding / is_pseudo=false
MSRPVSPYAGKVPFRKINNPAASPKAQQRQIDKILAHSPESSIPGGGRGRQDSNGNLANSLLLANSSGSSVTQVAKESPFKGKPAPTTKKTVTAKAVPTKPQPKPKPKTGPQQSKSAPRPAPATSAVKVPATAPKAKIAAPKPPPQIQKLRATTPARPTSTTSKPAAGRAPPPPATGGVTRKPPSPTTAPRPAPAVTPAKKPTPTVPAVSRPKSTAPKPTVTKPTPKPVKSRPSSPPKPAPKKAAQATPAATVVVSPTPPDSRTPPRPHTPQQQTETRNAKQSLADSLQAALQEMDAAMDRKFGRDNTVQPDAPPQDPPLVPLGVSGQTEILNENPGRVFPVTVTQTRVRPITDLAPPPPLPTVLTKQPPSQTEQTKEAEHPPVRRYIYRLPWWCYGDSVYHFGPHAGPFLEAQYQEAKNAVATGRPIIVPPPRRSIQVRNQTFTPLSRVHTFHPPRHYQGPTLGAPSPSISMLPSPSPSHPPPQRLSVSPAYVPIRASVVPPPPTQLVPPPVLTAKQATIVQQPSLVHLHAYPVWAGAQSRAPDGCNCFGWNGAATSTVSLAQPQAEWGENSPHA